MMVAIGIGLHNFGEGLAIGSTILIGEIALSTFLIIGFTIHNTTEGLAIIFPLAKSQKKKYWKTSHSRSNCRSSHYFRNMDRRFSVLSYCDSYLNSHRCRSYISSGLSNIFLVFYFLLLFGGREKSIWWWVHYKWFFGGYDNDVFNRIAYIKMRREFVIWL